MKINNGISNNKSKRRKIASERKAKRRKRRKKTVINGEEKRSGRKWQAKQKKSISGNISSESGIINQSAWQSESGEKAISEKKKKKKEEEERKKKAENSCNNQKAKKSTYEKRSERKRKKENISVAFVMYRKKWQNISMYQQKEIEEKNENARRNCNGSKKKKWRSEKQLASA